MLPSTNLCLSGSKLVTVQPGFFKSSGFVCMDLLCVQNVFQAIELKFIYHKRHYYTHPHLHIYSHTALLTILDTFRVLPISSMYQNFSLQFTSPPSSLASVLTLMLPLFGIHFLKTFVHHPLLPLLERSSKPISAKKAYPP